MIRVCAFCGDTWVVNVGPRNHKAKGLCAKTTCRLKALLLLQQHGLLTEEEETELKGSSAGGQAGAIT